MLTFVGDVVGNGGQEIQKVLVRSVIGEHRVARGGFGSILHRTVWSIVREAVKRDGRVQDIDGQLFTGGGIAGEHRKALVDREAGVPEVIEDVEGCEKRLMTLTALLRLVDHLAQ